MEIPALASICSRLIRCIVLGVAITFLGCEKKKAAPPSFPPPLVTITKPVVTKVQNYHEYNGNLEAIETVQVQARVKGFLNEIAFTEGDEVKKGALLFKIDPREYMSAVKKAEADLRKATTESERSRAEAERASRLFGTRSVGSEEYEQKLAVRDTANASMMQSQAALESAKIQLGYTEIYSPIDGQISRALITRGNLVGQNENTLLTTIVAMDPIYVYFDTPERDLVEFQKARQAGQLPDVLSRSLPLEIGVATEEGYPHSGNIDFRENRVDPGTGTVRLRGRIPNPRVPPGNAHLLYPGLYARVRVPSGQPRSLPAIPEDALMTGQEGRFVYVVGEGNVVKKRTVKVGPVVFKASHSMDSKLQGWSMVGDEDLKDKSKGSKTVPVPSVVSIESGLSADDTIVVIGLTKARPGQPVSPQMWELKSPNMNSGK